MSRDVLVCQTCHLPIDFEPMMKSCKCPERCECGQPGKHPYPIGGGWALACDRCRAKSEEDWSATKASWAGDFNLDPQGYAPSLWDRWARDAKGVAS